MNSVVVGMGDINYSLHILSVECFLCCFRTASSRLSSSSLKLLHVCEGCLNRLASASWFAFT